MPFDQQNSDYENNTTVFSEKNLLRTGIIKYLKKMKPKKDI